MKGETEWISIRIHGQSFILHQIRKMVGMAVLLMRADIPFEDISGQARPYPPLMDLVYQRVKVNIPKAPSLGLLLHEPVYGQYNRRCDSLENNSCDFKGEKISFESFQEKVDEFKSKWIYSQIYEEEMQTNT
jgi:tRNA pseudouridine38-40 synthase